MEDEKNTEERGTEYLGKMISEQLQEEYVNMGYKEEDEIASKYIEFHYIELPKYKKKEPSKFT